MIPWLQRPPEVPMPWLDWGVPIVWTALSLVCCAVLLRQHPRLRATPGWAMVLGYAWPVHLSIWAHRELGRMLAPPEDP